MSRPALWRRCVVKASTAVVVGTIWPRIRNQDHPPPRFYADLDIGRPDGMMSASFRLSLGAAASPGRLLTGGGYCLERGTPLARAVVASWEAVCVARWLPPGNVRWTSVVAHGSNITSLPGFMVDALAADARRGVRVFDASIWMADEKTAAWCRARLVGDDEKAAAACDVHHSSTT